MQKPIYAFPVLPPANKVWGKVIFSVACVKNSVHTGEYLGRYTSGQVPSQQLHPTLAGTPPRQVPHPARYTPPPDRYTPRQVHTPLQVHPPGRYTPRAVHAWKYVQQAGGTHPSRMYSCYCLNLFGPVLFGSKHLLPLVIKSRDLKNLKLFCWNI